jgi:hypothetical protein
LFVKYRLNVLSMIFSYLFEKTDAQSSSNLNTIRAIEFMFSILSIVLTIATTIIDELCSCVNSLVDRTRRYARSIESNVSINCQSENEA